MSLYRKVTSAWFSELLPCLLFLKNHQPKISLMPKGCILEWYVLLLFSAFLYLCGFVPFFGPFTAVLLAFPEQAEIDICVELAVESEASSICRLQPFFLFLVSLTVS